MRPKIKISELPDFDAAEFLQTDADIAAYLSTVLEENDAGLLAAARSTRAAYTPEKRSPDGRNYTWCSNPFIEFETGMANSNCIGCHQFAAPGSTFDQSEHNRFDKLTKDFPTDFLWSFDSGANHTADRILGVVRALEGVP